MNKTIIISKHTRLSSKGNLKEAQHSDLVKSRLTSILFS